MNNMFYTILDLNLFIIALSLMYFLIRKFIKTSLSRVVLLSIPILSLVLVALKASLNHEEIGLNFQLIELDEIIVQDSISSTGTALSWEYMYWMGVLFFLMLTFIKVFKILYFFKDGKSHSNLQIRKLKVSDNNDSFSFFGFIHLSANLNDEEKEVVINHELIHASKLHSLDILWYELIHSFFWFNPLLIVLKKELIQIHEFEVDEIMYSKLDKAYLKHLVAYTLGANSAQLLLTSQFYNNLTLTKRIKKMKSHTKKHHSLLALIPVVGISLACISWTYNETDIQKNTSHAVVKHLDKEPEFKGGEEALYTYIGQHVKYPAKAEKEGVQGTVHIAFVVEANGEVSKAKIKKGAHEALDAEALRVVKEMPAWNPGTKGGKTVATEMVLPITFKL